MVFYLSGPMEGVSEQEMCEWRNRMEAELSKRGHATKNPVKRENSALGGRRMSPSSAENIVSGDKEDMLQSHGIIVKITSIGREYWGTAMEIMFSAEVLKKPVFVICPPEYSSVRNHPWLVEHVEAWFEDEDDFLENLDGGYLPKSAVGDVRLAPIGYVDVSSDSLEEVDLNDWIADKAGTIGGGKSLRVLACKKVGPSPVVTEAN